MKGYLFLFVFSLIIANANAQMFHENFDAPSFGDSVTTICNGTHGFAINSRLQVSPSNSDSAFVDVGDTIILETSPFDLSGSVYSILSFKHICKVDYFDAAIIEVSPDGGNNWIQLTSAEYLTDDINSLAAPFGAQNNQFSSASYATWQPGNPATVPDNSWWKTEIFDASNILAGFSNVKVRFILYDSNLPGGNGSAGWFVDDITVNDTTSTFFVGQMFVNGFSYCQLPQTIPIYLSAFAFGYNLTDSINIHIYFGDGTDSIFYVPIQSTQGFMVTITHNYTMPGVFSLFAIMTSPDSIVDSVVTYQALLLGANCDSVTGNLYIDYNNDCVFNGLDESPNWGRVNLYYNNQILRYGWTDTSGFFSFNVPANNYEIKIDTNWLNYYINTLQVACPISGLYSISSVPSTGNDFAFNCNSYPDLFTLGYQSRIKLGYNNYLNSFYYSKNCQQVNVTAKFVLDPNISFINSYPPPNSVIGDTLIWNLSNFNLNDRFYPQITVSPIGLSIGDTVCFTSIIEPVIGDINTMDNIQTSCAAVVSSFDPNNKEVFPQGNISPSQELNYIINFQNTGNDTAYNVFILDTINSNLDFNTLRVNGASHNMTIDVLTGDVLKFNFDNIMLPDSGVNEPASHGFVSYSIKPKSNLPNGTQITNTAGIYFDFNLPVVTNTTLNIIDSTLTTGGFSPLSLGEGSGVRLYPNPSNEFITISSGLPENKNYEITISDVMGKQCLRTSNSELPVKIGIGNFQNGIYFISIRQNGSSIKNLKLVKY